MAATAREGPRSAAAELSAAALSVRCYGGRHGRAPSRRLLTGNRMINRKLLIVNTLLRSVTEELGVAGRIPEHFLVHPGALSPRPCRRLLRPGDSTRLQTWPMPHAGPQDRSPPGQPRRSSTAPTSAATSQGRVTTSAQLYR